MTVPLIVPDLGTPAVTLSVWHVSDGERVEEGDRVVEVLIPGAVIDLSAPAAGRLSRCLASVGARLTDGQVIAIIAPVAES